MGGLAWVFVCLVLYTFKDKKNLVRIQGKVNVVTNLKRELFDGED